MIGFDASDGDDSEIHILDLETGQEIQITDNDFHYYDVNLSPDGSRIVSGSERDEMPEVQAQRRYVIHPNGSNNTLFIDFRNTCCIVWQPDGKQVAFSSAGLGDVHAPYNLGIVKKEVE